SSDLCQIERIVEPRLTPVLAAGNPVYERNVHVPSYIVISTRKPPV
ncbi:MAG: hypothetical protein AVDCRST_MAG93-477, partial [uncultured Chloroflexia bacterium]